MKLASRHLGLAAAAMLQGLLASGCADRSSSPVYQTISQQTNQWGAFVPLELEALKAGTPYKDAETWLETIDFELVERDKQPEPATAPDDPFRDTAPDWFAQYDAMRADAVFRQEVSTGVCLVMLVVALNYDAADTVLNAQGMQYPTGCL